MNKRSENKYKAESLRHLMIERLYLGPRNLFQNFVYMENGFT